MSRLETDTDHGEVISNAIGVGLQGDAQRAVELLRSIEGVALTEGQKKYRSCMLERFGSHEPSLESTQDQNSFADTIVATYKAYWHAALTDPERREEYTEKLEQQLRDILDLSEGADSFEIERNLRERLSIDGLYALLGQTGVLRELMIWQNEERGPVSVEMPHGTYQTEVAFLDDFIISGWGQYATCETRGAGGWVADRTLFAVVPLYDDIEGEEFRVTFLGHETQHFLDLDAYPDMLSWELEYRAKLMELAMADETRERVLQKFIEDQSDDPASHHSYANRKLLNEMVERLPVSEVEGLKQAPDGALRDAALSLFQADTAKREGQ
ncbi:MAG: hypothetical protein AAF941_04460 [Pseudomonadota bacterium]